MHAKFMGIKQAIDSVGIRAEIGCLTDGFARLFRLLKTADHVLGDFTHASEGDVRRVFFAVSREQPVMEIPESGRRQRLAAAKLLRERGIGDESASEHQRMCLRKRRHQRAAVLHGKQVAIIA